MPLSVVAHRLKGKWEARESQGEEQEEEQEEQEIAGSGSQPLLPQSNDECMRVSNTAEL
jgi:hypothetical protein